jgi:CubicO group peptidase (beta-lactamase class C family)
MKGHRVVAIAVALSTLFFAASALAQIPAQPPNPKVDAIFSAYDKPDSPGCALGVIRNGQFIYTRGYGMANLEHNIPLTSTTVFDIGSTSKQFTTSSILLLSQQGKLSLDDDIHKFIPELPQYDWPITVRQLANHTSGIRDYLTLMSVTGVNFDGITTDDDALKL